MKKKALFALILALLPLSAAAAPAEAVLDGLRQKAAAVRTLASDFVQEKHLAMFQEVLTARGRFFFAKPDRLRWEIVEPAATGFVLDGGKGRRWSGRTGESEPFTLDREPVMKIVAGQLLAWAGADFDRLRTEYRITVEKEQPVVLRLDPQAPGGILDHLRIGFAADGSHVTQVEVFDRDGDLTRIRFVEVRVNPDLGDDLF